MNVDQNNNSSKLEIVSNSPLLKRVNYPVIEIKDMMIRVVLDDIDENKIELAFQPYQACKLTTYDCYLRPEGSDYAHNQIYYQKHSAWIEELKSALKTIDYSANFMNKALHFIIPAGDDILEVAAWKIEINYLRKKIIFPEDVQFPF